MSRITLIEEYTEVVFTKYEQLSYKDNEETYVELYVDDKLIGEIEVWKDSEEENREYICINYTIVYLDTLKKI
jgi:hypothetical protein